MKISRTKGKINGDYGIRDYYKYYSNTFENYQSSKIFNKIISEFNKSIVEKIIHEGLEYTPIKLQLTFCIRKTKAVIKIKNNRLINTTPIDWKTTTELWENDSEAKDKKIIIRFLNNHTSKYVFRIRMMKEGNYFRNKQYYCFRPCRHFSRGLAKRILDPNSENFEAFKLY